MLKLCTLSFIFLFCLNSAWARHEVGPIVLQLKWKHQFQFAGYYAAIEKGFYKEKGLDVELREAIEGLDPIQEVLAGKANFGIGNSDLLLSKIQGHPVVVLATIFQHSPLALMVRNDSGITTVQDLLGKKVMIEPQSAEIFAYLKNEGIDINKIKISHHSFDPEAFIRKDIDAMSVYVVDEPFHLLEAKIPVTFFFPRTGGVDFFGDTLFTTEDELDKNPERVKAFTEATLQGWDYAFKHSDEIIDLIIKKYSRRHSKKHLQYEAQKMKEVIRPDLLDIGYINYGRWKHIAEVYAGLGMIKSTDVDWDSFLYTPHKNRTSKVLIILLITLSSVLAIVLLFFLPLYYMNWKLRKEIIEREKIQTKLESNEKRFRYMIKNSHDAILIINKDSIVSFISDPISKITGFHPDYIIGKSCYEFIHAEDVPSVQNFVRQAIQTSGKNCIAIFRHKKANDTWASVEAIGASFIHDPAIRGIVVNLRDISERKQVELEKEKIQLQLIHSEKLASIGTLAAGMAHEINNPLAIITGYFEIMNNDLEGPDVPQDLANKIKKSINRQKDSIKRIASIVNGLRLSSRPDGNETKVFDIHKLIQETVSIIETIFIKSNIQLEVQLNSKKPFVKGNMSKFQQVLMNLLLNARDAVEKTSDSYVRISTEDDKNNFIFKICDNGHGIKKENVSKLFVPFYTSKDPDKGTGLGLYIAHTIVTSAKGKIHVESKEHEGTCFTIELPQFENQTNETNNEKRPSKTQTIQLAGTALIVDDEEEIRELLRKMLESFGINVHVATNGRDALELIRNQKYDYILTDMIMPFMNGDSLLIEASKLGLDNSKCYIITGNICEEQGLSLAQEVKDLICDFIQKPFTHTEILQALTKK